VDKIAQESTRVIGECQRADDLREDRLRSWKEIAHYLGVSVRTAQRLERQGMPVQRIWLQKRGSVYASLAEISRWVKGRDPTILVAARPFHPAPVQVTQRPESGTVAIAILSFEHETGDQDAAYLADGIAERLINSLSQLRSLRVIPSEAAFRFRSRESGWMDAARQFHVQFVLTGRVRLCGERLVASAHMVDVGQQAQVWGARYVKRRSDLFALEEELAEEIANSLRLQLSERKRLLPRGTENLEAYQLFIKAQHHIRTWTPQGMAQGLEYCRRASAIDPCYPAPHALLGLAYEQLGHGGILPPREAFPVAKAAATRALELDGKQAEAHLVLAMIRLFYDWDWSGAEREFRQALALAPHYARAHQTYANLLMAAGEFDQAAAHVEMAISLDPLAAESHYHLGLLRFYQGCLAHSLRALSVGAEVAPHSPLAPLLTSWILSRTGETGRAISLCEQFLGLGSTLSGSRAYFAWTLMWKAHLAWAYAWAGRRAGAEKILVEIFDELGEGYAATVFTAAVACFLGDAATCLRLLERAVEERIGYLILLDRDPAFEPLRGTARFEEIRRSVGLPVAITDRK
jgi:TolB-like protein